MLSSESTEVVRVTVPAEGAAIGDITIQFDRKMFAAHPSPERELFNRDGGRGEQPRRA